MDNLFHMISLPKSAAPSMVKNLPFGHGYVFGRVAFEKRKCLPGLGVGVEFRGSPSPNVLKCVVYVWKRSLEIRLMRRREIPFYVPPDRCKGPSITEQGGSPRSKFRMDPILGDEEPANKQ